MKNHQFLIWISLLCLPFVLQAEGRLTQSFMEGWEKVEISHTWNARDMQCEANDFYEGAVYYKKEYVLPPNWLINISFYVSKASAPVPAYM